MALHAKSIQMNRRSLFSFLGLMPLAAAVPAQADSEYAARLIDRVRSRVPTLFPGESLQTKPSQKTGIDVACENLARASRELADLHPGQKINVVYREIAYDSEKRIRRIGIAGQNFRVLGYIEVEDEY
jgi:hypothetical protein